MRRISRKVKQALSILLVAAMVITMVPQNTLSVSAAELGAEDIVDAPDTDAPTEETIEDAGGSSSGSSEDVTGSEEGNDSGEQSEEAIEEEKQDPADGSPAGEEQNSEEEELTGEEQVPADEAAKDGEIAADESAEIPKTALEEGNTQISVTVTFSGTDNVKAIKTIDADEKEAEITKNDSTYSTTVISGSSLKFTIEAQDGYKVTKVAVGENVVEAKDGVYTVENITTDTTIAITTEAKTKYNVKFNFENDKANAAQITSVKVNDTEKLEDEAVIDADSQSKLVEVTEGDAVTFAAGIKDGKEYKISLVKAGDAELAASNGVYTIAEVNADVTVAVATELDETQCQVLKFSAGETGTEKTFTATVAEDGSEAVTAYDFASGVTQFLHANAGNEESKATVKVALNENSKNSYVIEKIKLGDKELEEKTTDSEGNSTGDITVGEDGTWSFDVNFVKEAKTQDIAVYVTPAGTTEALTVTFKDNTTNMSLKVTESDYVKKQSSTSYSVAAGAQWLEFTVTSNNADYEPDVKYGTLGEYGYLEDGAEDIEAISKESADGSVVYSYKVAANSLTGDKVFLIDEVTAAYTVKLAYPAGSLKTEDNTIVAYVDGDSYYVPVGTDAETSNSTATFNYIEKGSRIVIPVEAAEGYKIAKASAKVGDTEAVEAEVEDNAYTYTATVTADTEITLETAALTEVVLLSGDEAVTPGQDGRYAVDYSVAAENAYYTAEVRVGGEAQAITKAEITTDGAKSTVSAENNATSAKITLDKEDAGKELTLELTTGAGENAGTEPLILLVAEAATADAVTVEGVDKNGNVNQVIDTKKEYKITVKDGVAKNTLAADVAEDAKGVTASVEDGKLVVTVGNDAAAGTAVEIKLYDVNDTEKKTLKTITVTPAELLDGVKPTVSLKRATDVSLTLTLGSKVSEEELENGKLVYKVVVTPEDTTNEKLIKAAKTEYVERDGASQDYVFSVAAENVGQGDGTAANFTVAVTLIRSKSGTVTADNEADNTAKATDAVTLKTATKNPYLTTKLSLKKLTTKLYTGQEDVVAAQAVFDKDTTFTNLKVTGVYEVYGKDTYSTSDVAATVDGDKIIVSADEDCYVGKYRIYVAASDKETTMKVAEASFDVQVQQGIYDLAVDTPASLYKQDGKAASFTAGLTYNDGNKYYKPKTAKVTWEVGRASTDKDENGNSVLIADPNVTIKNGKVTVNKNYTISADSDENEFTVRATAADYEGNKTCDEATFTITGEKAQLGSVVIVNYNDDDGSYDVIAKSGDTVAADELYGASAYVLKPGVTVKDHYSSNAFWKVMSQANVTYKSSSSAVPVYSYSRDYRGYFGKATKTAKNVKITATATDGSKATAVLDKLTVTYADGEDIGISINETNQTYDEESGEWHNYNTPVTISEEGSAVYYGQKDTRFRINIQTSDAEGSWTNISSRGLTDYSLSIKGAKITSKNTVNGYYNIIPTAATVTITLTSKSILGNGNKKIYTLTNKSYVDAKTNAPKLKTSDKLYGGDYQSAQKVTYTLPSEYAGKTILFTLDTADSSNSKKSVSYSYFEMNCQELGQYVRINSDAAVTLTFNLSYQESGYTYIPVGSYKLNYLVGGYDDDGNFVASAKPGTVSIKAAAQKTVKASLKNSYTLSALEGSEVELTLNKSGVELGLNQYSALKNANIKGTENKFRDYFEIGALYENDEFKCYTLKLKSGFTPEQIAALAGDKNNLTGWVSYYYIDEFGNKYTGQTQIKVTLKDVTTASKFALTKATTLSDASAVTVNAYTGKNVPVNVAYAKVTDGAFNASAYKDNPSDAITLTPTGTLTAGKYNVTLKIVPADSYYIKLFKEEGANTEELIAQYGIEVKTTITVTAKDTAKNKVKVDSKAASRTFTADDYAAGYYSVEVPYTTTAQNVPTFTVKAQKELDQKLFAADVNAAANTITVKLSKAALKNEVTAGTIAYGKKNYSVKFDLAYGENGAGYTTDTITLKLTLPAEAKTYEQVKADVEAKAEALTEGVYDAEDDNWVDTNKELVEEAIEDLVPADSDTAYELKVPETDGSKKPNSDESGYVKVVISLKDTSKENPTFEEAATVTLTLAKLAKTPSDLKTTLESYGDSIKATNATTKAEVLEGAREAVKITDYPNLRLVLTSYELKPATEEAAGSLSAELLLYDVDAGRDAYEAGVNPNGSITVTISAEIEQIKNLDASANAISTAWGGDSFNADEMFGEVALGDEGAAEAKQIVLDWAAKQLNNENIMIAGWKQVAESEGSEKKVDDFTFKQATSKEAGKVSGTLLLKDKRVEATEEEPDKGTKEVELTEVDLTARDDLSATETYIESALDSENFTVPNDEAQAKALILETAQKAIKNNQITAAYAKTTGDNPEDDFTFTAATYTTEGSAAFVIVLTDAALESENTKKISYKDDDEEENKAALTIPVIAQTTLEDAEAAAEEALKAFGEGKTEDAANISNSTSKESILNAVTGAVKLGEGDSAAKVAWKQVPKSSDSNGGNEITADDDSNNDADSQTTDTEDDYKLTEATTGEAGSIKGTIVITYGEDSVEVEVNFVIPKLQGEEENS